MRGMILAAGRGVRMGALTEKTPKPLLKAAGKYLIDYSIESLVLAGVRDIVINICYHADQIKQALGDGSRYGARFYYSEESEALETGGGIFQAWPLLGDQPFIVLSCDVITDYPLEKLAQPQQLAHLVLVDNPVFHPRGDFCLDNKAQIYCGEENRFTFANIGIYRPELFAGCTAGRFRLGDLLIKSAKNSRVSGEYFKGVWYNVGTPEDLQNIQTLRPLRHSAHASSAGSSALDAE